MFADSNFCKKRTYSTKRPEISFNDLENQLKSCLNYENKSNVEDIQEYESIEQNFRNMNIYSE